MKINKALFIIALIPTIIHCAEGPLSSHDDAAPALNTGQLPRSPMAAQTLTYINYAPLGSPHMNLKDLALQTSVSVVVHTMAQILATAIAVVLVEKCKGNPTTKTSTLESLQTLMALRASALDETEREQIDASIQELRVKILRQNKA